MGTCMKRHRHQEFLKFLQLIDRRTPAELDLHLIVDNYATHKHAKVKGLADQTSSISFPFYSHLVILVECGGTILCRTDREAPPSGRVS